MEFKSTLEKREKLIEEGYAKAEAAGVYKDAEPQLIEALKLTTDSGRGEHLLHRAIEIVKTIQPSISGNDLRIASTMITAVATQMVYILLRDGLITTKK